jgi:UDP-N-acetylglucosamine 1-carboxyvinyltransferase
MLAACAAKGETRIYGAAREPEIKALQDFLSAAGVEIHGAGSDTICIIGRPKEKDVVQRIIPDRIVASTIACALAASGGDIELRGIDPGHFSTVLHFLNEAGCDIISNNHALRIRSNGKLRGIGPVITEPYPGFPTDAQPVLMAAMLKAEGKTKIRETIFENRFRQVPELRRLGAEIICSGQTAEIVGVPSLQGAALTATDLRGGASMIVAGLAAEGETVICDEGHITRGYERFDNCLRALGADITLEY